MDGVQFPGKLMPPSNTLFVTPRDPYPSHSLASQPSSISSTNSLIVLTPDNYGHCTATLLGPTTSSGAKAHTFDKSAFASSIAYLRSQQDVCFSHVDDEHACSVAITFTLDTLGHIPMLRDAMRDCEQVTPEGETPHLAIEMAEGAPVTVWALVDLLACVISCHRQTYKGPNGQVADLCRQCVGGIRPQALADLLLVRPRNAACELDANDAKLRVLVTSRCERLRLHAHPCLRSPHLLSRAPSARLWHQPVGSHAPPGAVTCRLLVHKHSRDAVSVKHLQPRYLLDITRYTALFILERFARAAPHVTRPPPPGELFSARSTLSVPATNARRECLPVSACLVCPAVDLLHLEGTRPPRPLMHNRTTLMQRYHRRVQVSYIMSCDAVYHAAAFAAATEAGNGLRLYGLLPGDAVTDAQGRQVPVIAIFNHWKVRASACMHAVPPQVMRPGHPEGIFVHPDTTRCSECAIPRAATCRPMHAAPCGGAAVGPRREGVREPWSHCRGLLGRARHCRALVTVSV